MKPENETDDAAHTLGEEVFNDAVERARHVCVWEKERITKSNQPDITGLKAKLALLVEKRDALKELLRRMPSGNVAALRRRCWCYWTVAAILCVASVFFAHLALAPFGLGWETWLYSLAVGIVCAFWTDRTLEECN